MKVLNIDDVLGKYTDEERKEIETLTADYRNRTPFEYDTVEAAARDAVFSDIKDTTEYLYEAISDAYRGTETGARYPSTESDPLGYKYLKNLNKIKDLTDEFKSDEPTSNPNTFDDYIGDYFHFSSLPDGGVFEEDMTDEQKLYRDIENNLYEAGDSMAELTNCLFREHGALYNNYIDNTLNQRNNLKDLEEVNRIIKSELKPAILKACGVE